jgi:hypothetical protein
MKKTYVTPAVKTEEVEMGVFGCYGGTGASSSKQWKIRRKRRWWWPF